MQPKNLRKRLNGEENSIIKVNDRDRQSILLNKELKRGSKVREDEIPRQAKEQEEARIVSEG
jgi:hypothetical protein